MEPVAALERVVHCLDRAHEGGFKTKAFLRALSVVRAYAPEDLQAHAAQGTLTSIDGIGDSTARVILEALRDDTTYLDKLDQQTKVPVSDEGRRYLELLRGDCHLHSKWSDGGATVDAMVQTAIAIGHDYIVLTDHSPRLTVAHGLNEARLMEQLAEVAELNRRYAPFRILSGIEVDILEDGTLDHSDDVLSQLDVVVASVHSKLKMPHDQMTQRMLAAVQSPHVDILGHCTGRMIGKRDPSQFDAAIIFAACAANHTAVEINCRPERLDPPRALLQQAVDAGCWFAINSDAHATGQLEWQPKGCDRAAEHNVPIERVLNTLHADDLLQWCDPTARP
jgi:putative hydrolase